MAKIVVTIEADSVEDYLSTIEALTDQSPLILSAGNMVKGEPGAISTEPGSINYVDGPEVTREEVSQIGSTDEPAKRTRRTKAQIEADNAAAAAPKQEPARDPFAEQVREVTQDEPATITIAQLRAALSKWMAVEGNTASKAQELLTKTAGVANLGALDAKQYAAVLAALEV